MRTIKFNEYKIVRETENSLSKTQQAKTKITQVHKPNSQSQLTLMLQPKCYKTLSAYRGRMWCIYDFKARELPHIHNPHPNDRSFNLKSGPEIEFQVQLENVDFFVS